MSEGWVDLFWFMASEALVYPGVVGHLTLWHPGSKERECLSSWFPPPPIFQVLGLGDVWHHPHSPRVLLLSFPLETHWRRVHHALWCCEQDTWREQLTEGRVLLWLTMSESHDRDLPWWERPPKDDTSPAEEQLLQRWACWGWYRFHTWQRHT